METILFHMSTAGRAKLVDWRKEVVQARERWLALAKEYGKLSREFAKFCKDEAAACLKHERACTDLIQVIDGIKAGLGKWETSEKQGRLTWCIPKDLQAAYRFCKGLAETAT